VACMALRVKDPWLGRPDITDLRKPAAIRSVEQAPDRDFWEPSD
jgi:hypothetical protein